MQLTPKTFAALALSALMVAVPVASFAQGQPQQQQQAQGQYYVKPGVTLNGRSGPGTGYGKVSALKAGTQLQIVKKQGDWAQVKTDGGTLLWVFLNYLTQTAPQAQKAAPQAHKPAQQQPQQPPRP
ncbi:SH3 domain-containing protein [Celeribacter ethanolicus]|uniref:SH3 domain-containing protein n=1 Tax=Celeribacter ethanolicus TaxID=1758178 RepID=UPI000830E623|nr:SH3 domain-containing protein [Celeribacter ethanolicus]TNE65258.1 MAG: SH3 domain-containing protein [Paracoccaceae bacterium]